MPQIAKNKKAFFDYEILEKFEAGITLFGYEVKAARQGKVNLKGSYIMEKNEELFVDGIHIGRYDYSSEEAPEGTRRRKLLLHKKEIIRIMQHLHNSGLTVVPLTMYTKNHKIKVEIGIVRGRKKADKRHVIRDRQEKRRMKSVMKTYS